MKILLILLALLPCDSTKTRVIDISATMEKATTRQLITVYGYTDNLILYGISSSKDTLKADCNSRKTSESDRLNLIEHNAIPGNSLAGKWPEPGEKVLYVVEGNITLFAKIEGTSYRFWDPKSIIFANSAFSMEKDGIYLPYWECSNADNEKYIICPEGCLTDKKALDKKYNLK